MSFLYCFVLWDVNNTAFKKKKKKKELKATGRPGLLRVSPPGVSPGSHGESCRKTPLRGVHGSGREHAKEAAFWNTHGAFSSLPRDLPSWETSLLQPGTWGEDRWVSRSPAILPVSYEGGEEGWRTLVKFTARGHWPVKKWRFILRL